jgi:hypothetical protein
MINMDITRRHCRRAAVLVASLAATLAIGGVADAHATSLDQEMRSVLAHGAPGGKVVGKNRIHWPKQGVTLTLRVSRQAPWMCQSHFVCLYQDKNGEGRKIHFEDYGTYKLARYGMGAGPRGVSSYYDNQIGATAGSKLIGPNFRLPLHNFGNVPRIRNDRATYVRLFP